MSVRNGFAYVSSSIRPFVEQYMQFTDDVEPIDEVMHFWRFIGLDEEMVEVISMINPKWHNGALLVAATIQNIDGHVQMVCDILFFVFKFQKHKGSRWLRDGSATRNMIASIFVGLPKVVELALVTYTDYKLHGFERLTLKVRKFMAITAVAAYCPEGVFLEVFDNPCLVRSIDAVETAIHDECHYVDNLNNLTWERLVQIVGEEGYGVSDIVSDAVHATRVTAAFLEKRIVREVKKPPWSLARGNIEQNVSDLIHGDVPDNLDAGLGQKACDLARKGFNTTRIVEGLGTLHYIPWNTLPCENGHGSLAAIHKVHPHLSTDMLAMKSLFHQARAYLQKKSAEEVKVERWTSEIVKLTDRMDNYHLSGRHVFCGELVEQATIMVAGGAKRQRVARETMRVHGDMHKSMSLAEKQKYEYLAKQRITTTKANMRADIEYKEARLQLFQTRLEEEKRLRGVLPNVAAHRFSDADVEELYALYTEASFRTSSVISSLDKTMEAPVAPLRHEQALFLPNHTINNAANPVWLRKMCKNRDDLRGTALGTSTEEGSDWFLFLFAVQCPLEVWFLRMVRETEVLPAMHDLGAEQVRALLDGRCPHRFIVAGTDTYVRHDACPALSAGASTLVLDNVVFIMGGIIVGHSAPLAFEDWLSFLPDPGSAGAGGRAAGHVPVDRDRRAALLAEYPWLLEYLGQPMAPVGGEEIDPADGVECDVGAIIGAAKAVMDKEREAMVMPAIEADQFFVRIRQAGAWGAADESFATEAKRGAARQWCKAYNLGQSMVFSVDRLSKDVALASAAEWCRRMQYFFEFMHVFGEGYVYTKDDIDGYVPSDEWITARARVTPDSYAAGRVMIVDNLRPR